MVNDAFVQFSGADEPIGRLESAKVTLQQPWIEGEAYEVALLTSSGGTIAHEIPVAVETPVGRPLVLRPDGAARHLRRRDPGRARDALAAVGPAHPARLAARRDGAHGRAARVPGDRRDARGLRARRRGLAGVRRRGARAGRGRGRVPLAHRDIRVARAAPPRRERGGRVRRPPGAAGRGRDRAAQPRRGRRDRRRLLGRRARAGRVPRRSALRCTTRPRGSRSSRPSRTCARRSAGSRCSA